MENRKDSNKRTNKFLHVQGKVDTRSSPKVASPKVTRNRTPVITATNVRQSGRPSHIVDEHSRKDGSNQNKAEVQSLKTLQDVRDSEIKRLNSQLEAINEQLQNAKKENEVMHQKYSRKLRGSLSTFEARLESTNIEHESTIDGLQEKLKREVTELQRILETREIQYHKDISKMSGELSVLRGRLDESRSDREALLEDMKEMSESYRSTIHELEESLKMVVGKYHSLQMEVNRNSNSSEIEKVQLQVKALLTENQKFQDKSYELSHLVNKRDDTIRELESQLELLNKRQIEGANDKNKLLVESPSPPDNPDFAKIEQELESQKEKSKAMENICSQREKKIEQLQLDLMASDKVQKELEQKISSLEAYSADISKKLDGILKENEMMLGKVKTVESSLEGQRKLRIEATLSSQRKIKEHQTKLKEKELELAQARKVVGDFEHERGKTQALEKVILEKDEKQKKLEKKLDKNERKLSHQDANISMLKDACTLLDNQLVDFEVAYKLKCSEVEILATAKFAVENELTSFRQELEKLRLDFIKTKAMKVIVEHQLEDTESHLKFSESNKSSLVQGYEEEMQNLQKQNKELAQTLNEVSRSLKDSEKSSAASLKLNDSLRDANKQLQIESSNRLTEIIVLKSEVKKITEANEKLTNEYKVQTVALDNTRKEYKVIEQHAIAKDQNLNEKIDQNLDLINHLYQEIEILSRTKKGKTLAERLFGWDSAKTTPTKMVCSNTPTARRPLANTNNEPIDSLGGSNYYKCHTVDMSFLDIRKEECALQKRTSLIEQLFVGEGKNKMYINLVKKISHNHFLLACEEGLFALSCWDKENSNELVKIVGVGALHLMEFIPSINYAIAVEGKSRRLVMIHLGLMRCAAEAPPSACPKVTTRRLGHTENVFLLQVQISPGITLVVTNQMSLTVFVWEGDSFIPRHTVCTPKIVTCVLLTQTSVLYGTDKIMELDLRNYSNDNFLDESDQSLVHIPTSLEYSCSFPISILDVSLVSSCGSKEYLICLSDIGVFIDSFGKRTRELDIVWSKLPLAVVFNNSTLYIFHFDSLEIQTLSPLSYVQKQNVENKLNSTEVPSSVFLPFSNPRFLGIYEQCQSSSVFLGLGGPSKTEVMIVSKSNEKLVSNTQPTKSSNEIL